VRFRPSYPALAIDAILAGLGDASVIRAADVGAGTGISARLLADRGVQVTAVEPNAAMRTAADKHPRVAWVNATAEATGLGDSTQDLVHCAQAFHWFRPVQALHEFARILRPGGRLALMWNQRDATDPLTIAYTAAIIAAATDPNVERMPFDPEPLKNSTNFTAYHRVIFSYRQPLDLAGLIGRATSASYVPREGPKLEHLKQQLADAHRTHAGRDGQVELSYVTEVYLATRT
jgi:ubiquinone/menaquinone biosynthesis C-methylase UbiE